MRKIFFMSALALASLAGTAKVQIPQFFYENFGEDGGLTLPDMWDYTGIDATPDDPEHFFIKGEYWVPLASDKSTIWAVSNSSFKEVDGVRPQADEWLISPEFTITTDNAILRYDVLADGSTNKSEYSVYISEDATTPAQFKRLDPIFTDKISDKIETKTILLSGMKDKTVYLAFNNHSTNAAYLGFTNIEVAPYFADVVDNTPVSVANTNEVEVSLNVWVKTEQPCAGITAKLVASDGTESEFTASDDCQNGYRFNIVFPDKLKISEDKPVVTYTIAIVPNLGLMPATIVEGSVLRSVTYNRKVLLEEFTGTWCNNCTRGYAAMDKYAHDYPDNFIAVTLHGDDPMDCAYTTSLGLQVGVSSFPTAVFSREQIGDPTEEDILNKLINDKSPVRLSVDMVEYTADNRKVNVKYSVRNGFSTTKSPYSAAIILAENGVTPPEGLDPNSEEYKNWQQQNGLSGVSETNVERAFGEGWWPYCKPYSEAPAILESTVYNHVGRGVYPGINGKRIASEWTAEQDEKGEISFTMPSTVNPANTYIVAVVIEDSSERILNAQEIPFALYNTDTAVGVVEAEDAAIMRIGDNLVVSAEAGSVVRVFSADGLLLGTYNHNGGDLNIDGSSFGGMLIVRVDSRNNASVKKLMWK